jgi:heat shock protein HslJ
MILGTDEDEFKYTAREDGTLVIPAVMITEKDCAAPEGVMSQELDYVAALQSAAAFRLTEERLEIDDAAGETVLVFVEATD